MRKDIIAMSQKERQRYHLLKMVIGGKITLKETDNLMGVSYRQAKRLKKKLIRAKPRRKPKARATSEEQWIYMASAVERGHFY